MNISQCLLPFQLIQDTSKVLLTSFGGLPLVMETFRALGLRESIKRHLPILHRQGRYKNFSLRIIVMPTEHKQSIQDERRSMPQSPNFGKRKARKNGQGMKEAFIENAENDVNLFKMQILQTKRVFIFDFGIYSGSSEIQLLNT